MYFKPSSPLIGVIMPILYTEVKEIKYLISNLTGKSVANVPGFPDYKGDALFSLFISALGWS